MVRSYHDQNILDNQKLRYYPEKSLRIQTTRKNHLFVMIKVEKRVRFGLSAELILKKYLHDPRVLRRLRDLKIRYGITREQTVKLFRYKM